MPVDYAALADEARKVDYSALANEARGVLPGTEAFGGKAPGVPSAPLPYPLRPGLFGGRPIVGSPIVPAPMAAFQLGAGILTKADEATGMGDPRIQGGPIMPKPGTEPQIANKIGDAVSKATTADPALDLIKAYNPRDQRFVDKVPDAAADIKAASGKEALTNEDVIAHAPAAKEANRHVWEQWTAPARQMGARADGAAIVKATQESLAGTLDPQAQAEILQDAKRIYGSRPLTEPQLEELLQEKNGELKPFYSKDEATRSAAEAAGARTGRSQALLEAQSREIRNTLYNMLDPENKGAGPREIQQRYGAISTLEDEAWSNRNKVLAEHAGTTFDKAMQTGAEILNIPGKVVTGQTGKAVTDVLVPFRGSTDPLVMRAFRNTGAPNPLPTPTRPQVAGYLPPAPITTPPPVDASFVRGAPAMTQPPNPARALPPASAPPIVTPPPGDTSFVRGAQGMNQPPNAARALPPATTRILGAPDTTTTASLLDAAKGIQRGPNGRFFKVYSGMPAKELTPQQLMDLRASPLTREDIQRLKSLRVGQ